MKSIGIVGGGVIGLSTAAAILQDNPQLKIVVYADAFTPHTTSDVSAGFALPYLVGKNDDLETIMSWINDTVDYLIDFGRENDGASGAVTMLSGYLLWKKAPKDITKFRDCVKGWRTVDQSELNRISSKGRYACGTFFTTALCDCSKYLPCLMNKLAAKGVTFIQKKVASLDDVADLGHDIVINTAGVLAKHLTDDPEIRPLKGQVIIAKAPWINHFFMEVDGDSYIIPKSDYLVVGGTHDEDMSLTMSEGVSNRMWEDAHKMIPNLKSARMIGERVGIRPGRSSVRIEIEQAMTRSSKKYVVLHHYGHGGCGVATHWGSAKKAASVLKPYLDQCSKL